jgi:flagellar biosynthesis anti-sigma factor FlgM
MKIDANRVAQDTQATDSARKTAKDGGVRRAGDVSVPGGGDRVEVSENAALMSSALKAAHEAPDVRTELVERMRQKLAAGEVGNDAGKLADALIDNMLK